MYNETIKCMICGKETTQINHAHLKSHGMTSAEYREQYPNIKIKLVDADKYRAYEKRFKHQIEEWE